MSGARISRPPVYRIAAYQLAVLLPAGVALQIWIPETALSFVAGSLIAIIPQAWFARGVFRWRGARFAQRAVRAGYVAEIGKYTLSAAGFALVFALLRPISGGMVFVGYGVMLAIQIIGAWRLLRAAKA